MLSLRVIALGLALVPLVSGGAGADPPHAGAMAHHGPPPAGPVPALPGQDAFAAIQEIVRLLEADPATNWSKVDLEALRQHLIDMNEVTLKAQAAARELGDGLEVAVTGSGRTVTAIQRMVPAWAHAMAGQHGWRIDAVALPNGEALTVTAGDPQEVRHIRGLGFIGLLASGSHHQPHHLAIAKGEWQPPQSAPEQTAPPDPPAR